MEFLLTPNNTKVLAKANNGRVPVDINKGIAFNGDEPIDFEDETGVVPFSFQTDYAYAAADSVTDFANRTSVKRIFYSLGGKYLLLVGVPLSWVNSSPAGDLIIDPTTTAIGNDDVYLQDATNYGSNPSLIIGKSSGTNKKRTIMKFDVSSVPSSAIVINAQMKLRYYGTSGTPWIDRSVQAHQLLVNWNETQATRDVRLTGTSWALQYGAINGTDAKTTMESTTLFKINEFPVWKNWDLTTLTQKWINGSATNYGVILWATNEDNNGMNLWFRSSEYSDSNFHPRLEVTWSQTLQAVYFLKDHLGSIRATILDSTGAPILGYDDYDPWGYPLAQRTQAIPTPYLQGGSKNKFTGKEYDDEFGLKLSYFGARYYDGLIGRWISVDPLANKYPAWSPYVYTLNNPTLFIDPNGEETYVNSTGYVIQDRKILDAKDPSVYLVNGDDLSKIGEVGGNIVVTTIFANLLNQNMATAAGIYDPSTFRDLVTTGGAWDLKNLHDGEKALSIFAQGELDGKTTYSFGELTDLRSDDLGNIHYGATGLATGLFSEATLLREAGLAQIVSDYFNDERGPQSIVGRDATRPPYGDDLRDQKYINVGFGIQGHKPPSGLYNFTVRTLTTAFSEHRAAQMYKTYPGLNKPD